MDHLPSLNVISLRIHLSSFILLRYLDEKELPYEIRLAQIENTVIQNAAATLIHRMEDIPSDLRLLIFEIRGYDERQCFTRGWSPAPHRSNQLVHIREHLVKYHLPEYQLMPPYAPVETWQVYCSSKQFSVEAELRQEAIDMDEAEN